MALALQGTGVSNGIAIGPVHVLRRDSLEVLQYNLTEDAVDDELARFRRALSIVKHNLRLVRDQIPHDTQNDIIEFIDTHMLMLNDSTLSRVPLDIIRTQRCNAEWALKIQRDALVRVFDEMDDPYLRTRRDDIDHVVNSIQSELLSSPIYHQVNHIHEQRLNGHIIVADDLSPADTILMQHQGIAAFITERGGPTSHTAILARSLGIPAVVGLHNAQLLLNEFETLVVDGQTGVALANPETRLIQHYLARKRHIQQIAEDHKINRHTPAITLDGHTITLHANIELLEDIDALEDNGAEGVGLYRTEFLFMNREQPPSEQEHYDTYRQILERLNGKMLTIRTLDLGADKQADSLHQNMKSGSNPALGLRAIRLCLQDPDIFIPQLRAILRASVHGPMRIMIPMISNAQEIIQIRQQIHTVCQQLQREAIAFNPDIPLGGMIEVPAAAINAHMLCPMLDFVSIGTNDLIQYTLAIDRVDDEVNYLYDPLDPAVLRLIAMVISAAGQASIPVSMCGEMAGDPLFTSLLLGMGLREFSMHPNALAEVKYRIQQSSIHQLSPHIDALLNCTVHEEFIQQLVKLDLR